MECQGLGWLVVKDAECTMGYDTMCLLTKMKVRATREQMRNYCIAGVYALVCYVIHTDLLRWLRTIYVTSSP